MNPHDLPTEKIVHAYEEDGLSVYALARQYDVSWNTMRRTLHDAGVTLRTGYPQHDAVAAIAAQDGDAIERRYRNGESAHALASEYGISAPTLRRILTDRDVPRRGIAEARRLRAQQQRQRRRS